MKTDIVRIGNSKGIRLPKPILEQCGLQGTVELEVEGKRIVIRPVYAPCSGRDKVFAATAKNGDDTSLGHDIKFVPEWDKTKWRW